MTDRPRVTIGFVSYNKSWILEECVDSVLAQSGGPYRLIFVDNASTDEGRQRVEEKYGSRLEIVGLDRNRGPNSARNLILDMADTEYILFLDADVVLEPNVLPQLLDALDRNPEAAAASPKILDRDDRTRVQFVGTEIHFVGAAIHRRENRADTFRVASLGGACLLVRRETALRVGKWDEDFFFGWTDGDFLYRLGIAGHPALCVAGARVYHPMRERGFDMAEHQIRNRWCFMLKNYSVTTLLAILPMLFVYELSLIAFLIYNGRAKTYLSAVLQMLLELPRTLRKRRAVQRMRAVHDTALLSTGRFTIRDDIMTANWLTKSQSTLNRWLDRYCHLISHLI